MGLILDTNFVITAEREAKRRESGKVDRFLAARPQESFFITFTVAGECFNVKANAHRPKSPFFRRGRRKRLAGARVVAACATPG